MTTQELLAILLPSAAGAVGGALQSSQGRQQQQQQEAQAGQNRVQQALQNLQQTSQNLQMNRQGQAETGLAASPLGSEQEFLKRQRMAQVLLPMVAGFKGARPTDAGVAGSYTPQSNLLAGLNDPRLLSAVSDSATAQSLANRRSAVAQVNPDVVQGSLAGFGLDPSFDQQTNQAQLDSSARLKAYEAAQTALANQQLTVAQQQGVAQGGQQAQKKGGGIGGFLGGLLKTAAPIAAAFIPGVGPAAAAAIAGGGTALGSKLQGQSWGSSLGQGAVGGVMGGVGKSLAQGTGLNPYNEPRTLNNAMTGASFPQVGMPAQFGPQQLPLQAQGPPMSEFPQAVGQVRPPVGQPQARPASPLPTIPQMRPVPSHGPQPQPQPLMGPQGGKTKEQVIAEIMQNPFVQSLMQGGGMPNPLRGVSAGARIMGPGSGAMQPWLQRAILGLGVK